MLYALSAGFLLLSGVSGLIYEISWARLLSLYIGSDNAAISIVVSCFFLGMALGSYLSAYVKSSKTKSSKSNPFNLSLIHFYILIEFLIGLSALALLPVFSSLDNLIQAFPFFATSLLGKFLISTGLLIIPTVCLGATFPVVAALVISKQDEIGLRIGQLYFFNTLGAVIGSLGAGFLLIPSYGLDGAIYIAAVLNFSIVFTAWWYRKKFINESELSYNIENHTPYNRHSIIAKRIAMLSLIISGFILVACEIAWTKYFSILTGSSIRSFSIILACTIGGIATGSWLICSRIKALKNPSLFLIKSIVMTSLLLMIMRWGINITPNVMEQINVLTVDSHTKQLLRYLLVGIFVFPITFMFGLMYPIALNLSINNYNILQSQITKAYSLNILAGIVGALVAGFLIIPNYGTDSLILSMTILLLAMPVFVLLSKLVKIKRMVRYGLLATSIGIIGISVLSSGMAYEPLISAVDYRYKYGNQVKTDPEYLYLKEGKNSVISLVKYDNKYAVLQNNGLRESMIALDPSANTMIFETLQAYLPYFIHPDPKSAFVVGFGGGITTQAFVDTNIENINIIEIEKHMVEAVRQLSLGPALSLEDTRVKLNYGDARTALLTNRKKYDIITSQPSHPWVAGSANLLSIEYFELVKSRLNENGIFTQWVGLFNTDVETFKSTLKSFFTAYPYGFTMANNTTGDVMLVGSNNPITFDYTLVKQRMASPGIAERLAQFKVMDPGGLLWLFSQSRDEIISSTLQNELSTDLNLLSETQLPSVSGDDYADKTPYAYIKANARLDLLPILTRNTAKYNLFELGNNYLNWNLPDKARQIALQLMKVDPVWGKSLTHENYYRNLNYQEATNLYQTQSEWMDISHYRQFQITLQESQWDESNKIINRISSETLQRTARAMLLYEQKNWIALAALQPQSQSERSWQLVAKIKQNDFTALAELASITELSFDNLPHIKLMTDTYRKIGALPQANWLDQQITFIINSRLGLYNNLIETANLENNSQWAKSIKKEIQRVSSYKQQFAGI